MEIIEKAIMAGQVANGSLSFNDLISMAVPDYQYAVRRMNELYRKMIPPKEN